MKNVIYPVLMVGLLPFAGAFAASQGLIGASSTATYSNTIGESSQRQIQILNLSDTIVTPSSGRVQEANGLNTRIGVIDRFCVVDTAGGTVKLTFTGPQNASAQWVARSVAGTDYIYVINAGIANGPMTRLSGAAASITVPSNRTVTNPSACSTGNMQKLAAEGDAAPTAGTTYVALMTVVASPN